MQIVNKNILKKLACMVNGITFALMKYRFIKVSDYAREHGISAKSVYMQIKNKKIQSETKFGLILIKVKV